MEKIFEADDQAYCNVPMVQNGADATAEMFNKIFQALVNNDAFIKRLAEEQARLLQEHIQSQNNVDNTADMDKPVSTAQQAALDKKLDKTGDAKDATATFTQASTRENISSGEKLSAIFGKVRKWFADLKNVDNTSDMDKPVSTAQQAALDAIYAQANQFTLNKIAELVGGAPTTLDTIAEVAAAIEQNKSVIDALDAAIGKKANQSELDTHTGNSTIHVTASERTKWNNMLPAKQGEVLEEKISGLNGSLVANQVKFAWFEASAVSSQEINFPPYSKRANIPVSYDALSGKNILCTFLLSLHGDSGDPQPLHGLSLDSLFMDNSGHITNVGVLSTGYITIRVHIGVLYTG